MRRGLVLGAATLALIVMMVAPGATPPAPTVAREVSAATLVCPEDLAGAQSWRALSMVADPTAAAGRDGRALVQLVGEDTPLASLGRAGAPVAVVTSGHTVPTAIVTAEGGFAPGIQASVIGGESSGPTRGLASAACVAPAPQWWFVGSGSEAIRDASLLVSNPTTAQARFDIDLIGRTGPLTAVGSNGLELAPQHQARIRLSALAEGEPVLSVHVTATTGRVAAALWDVAQPHANQPQGVDFLAGSLPPRPDLLFAGIPSGPGARELVLLNPGGALATASLHLLTPSGRIELSGLPQVVVPAARVVTVDLARVLADAGGALEVTSDAPLTGAIRVASIGAPRDLHWLAATDPTTPDNPLAGAVLAAGPGLTSTIAVAARDEPVSGTLTVQASEELPRGASVDPRTLAASDSAATQIPVSVPAHSQLIFDVPAATRPTGSTSVLLTVTWRADAGSGPAHLAHSTSGALGLTGHQWAPAVSSVQVDAVREDAGPLMGQ